MNSLNPRPEVDQGTKPVHIPSTRRRQLAAAIHLGYGPMSSFNVSKALRTLGLAAALMGPLVAGTAFADGEYVVGPAASQSWTQSTSRTPLAHDAARTTGGFQSLLEQSGATGNGGQHN
jgi:hypothetical protein